MTQLLTPDTLVAQSATVDVVNNAKEARESLEYKINILQNAQHSSMLSPIEEFFSKLKSTLSKKTYEKGRRTCRVTSRSSSKYYCQRFKGLYQTYPIVC